MKKTLKIALPILLGVLLIFYSYSLFSPEQINEIKKHFAEARYNFVGLSLIFSILSHIIRAHRWRFFAHALDYRPKFHNSFMALNAAYLLNLVIPRAGEVSRAFIIDKYEGIAFKKGFGTIIAERLVDLIFLLGFTALASIAKADVLWNYFIDIIPIKKLSNLALIGFSFFIAVLLILKYSKGKLILKTKNFLSGLKEGILSITKMKHKWAFLVYSFLIWIFYLAAFYAGALAVQQTSNVEFTTMLLAFVAGSFSVAFTNSGFGSYPLFVAGILALFGISMTAGTAFGWILWTSNLVSILILGALSFLFLPILNRSKHSS